MKSTLILLLLLLSSLSWSQAPTAGQIAMWVDQAHLKGVTIGQDCTIAIDGTFTCTGLYGSTLPVPTIGFLNWTGSNWAFSTVSVLTPGPTSPNSVAQVLTSTPSGGVAGTATWSLPGVTPNPQTGTSYTYLSTDRVAYTTFSNGGAIAVTLPQASSAGFGSNWVNVSCDIGAGIATITPTTSTISYTTGSAYVSAAATLALTTGKCAWIYSDNVNYFAIVR